MSDPKHDVFLSFRGEDTRDNFTSHLHAELCRKKIETFIDNRLDRGEEISSALYRAIQESKVYVVILSEHYASSSWCLDELTEILKCKQRYEREVIPVFYKVDPSNVRHQRQSYADDFVRHHQRFGGKVDSWKAALNQVAGLSGWDSQVTRPESTLVTEIVKDILKKLNSCFLSNYEGMTGIDMHIEQIQSLLLLELPTVRIIGIWGMGGIGKTTIATAVFEKLATQFSSKSITLNVQQEIERVGLDDVKSKYLSKLLGEDIKSSEYNFSLDPRLKRTKVLLVFDDVKDSDQLKDLIGMHSNFGLGSRIIVTSRDKQVLENANADEIYQVREMDYQDSLRLFCLFAFKQNNPKESFVSLTEKVLDYAKGLPLALKVLGSLLYGKANEVWESQLQKLEKLPDLKIFRLLKLSYDGLDDEQKDIFLDIACFHRGEMEKHVTLTLESCGFSAYIGMDVLKDRSLISISKYGEVWMHDLIQEMGHEIVRLQCVDDPGKRSRLWKTSDIYEVLSKNKGKGTDAIQCIFLDMDKIKKVQLHADAFKKMHNLRMIMFYSKSGLNSNVTFHGFLKSFPDHLKFLSWDEFPQRSLLQEFCPESLVILDMPDSHLEQLWEGDQALPNLKRLNLSYSEKLIAVPDLSFSPNIEEVILSGCVSLIEVYSSSFLNNLYILCTERCTELKSIDIPSNILSRPSGLVSLGDCHNLETLLISSRTDHVVQFTHFYRCYKFERMIFFCEEIGVEMNDDGDYEVWEIFSDIVTRNIINDFYWFDISKCESLTCLPAEVLNLKFLRTLSLSGCLKLEELPEIKETMENLKVLILDETAIKELPSSLYRLVGLEELSLKKCRNLKIIPSSIGNLNKLLKLDLTYCESLETFPCSIFKLKLTKLNFQGCSMLRNFPEIPNDIGRLSSLMELSLQESGIVNLPESMAHLSSLKSLDLTDCKQLECVPNNISHLSSLTELSLKGSSIVNLPESMAHLSSLKSLNLSDCKLLECVPKLPPNLNQVWAFDCPSIKSMVLNSRSDPGEGTFKFHLTNSQYSTSLSNIGEEACIKISDDAYRSVVFCFPGSAVPRWFHYYCKGHSVTMRKVSPNLCSKNKLIGFALCAVLGPEDMDESFIYKFEFISDGEIYSSYHCLPENHLNWNCPDRFLKHDHTFLWKHELNLEAIGDKIFHAQNFTFEFLSKDKVKECGICPLFTKEIDTLKN